jgi:hypothetical protein
VLSRPLAEVVIMNSTRCTLFAALLSSLLLAAPGCKKESAAGAEATPGAEQGAKLSGAEPASAPPIEAAPATPSDPAASAPSGDVVALGSDGKAKVMPTGGKKVADTPSYTVTLAAPARVGKGAQGTVVLEVTPKAGWKLNKEFPTKLTVTEPAGVKVAKKEQTVADAVAFADKAGRWQVQFQSDSAGAKDFTGVLKFAVCTDTSCDPKKEELAWNVAVSE